MRTRSQIRKQQTETPSPKPSAAERTVPIPGTEASASTGTAVTCPACSETIPADKLLRQGDRAECPECGATLAISGKPEPPPSKQAPPPETKPASTELKDPHKKYCGECASEWPLLDGPHGKRFHINCGHMTAMRVAHPDEAKRNAPPGGLQTRSQDVPKAGEKSPSPKASDRSDEPRPGGGSRATMPAPESKRIAPAESNTSMPAPKVTIEGERISVEWGKSTFPLGMMSNFTVGGFFVSIQLPPGANKVAAAKDILAELREIAEHAFKVQSKWYLEKLESLK